jgi:mono/diheme cytochrome c family protein
MNTQATGLMGLTAFVLLLGTGCGRLPGQPDGTADAPDERGAYEFSTLYAQNCAACHGANGTGGPALALANPVYPALAPGANIRRAIALGVDGTMMPAFSTGSGGMLTDAQIDVIVVGIQKWGRPQTGIASKAPPYLAHLEGDAKHGKLGFTASCAGCHGENGEGGRNAGSIVDDSFLALVSDQGLRTTILAGRPDIGQPDWRGVGGAEPLTDQELTDIVTWLASRRATAPGRPYPAPKG